MTWTDIHPALNAALNATSGVYLVLGLIAVSRRQLALHRKRMLTAISISAVFLVSYLIRVALTGTHRYPGDGVDKMIYLVILTSHTILAAVAAPLVLRTAYVAQRGKLDKHRKLVRFAAPIWLYVSVTGVIVYLMLYHLSRWLP
jgi:putative membrane protein